MLVGCSTTPKDKVSADSSGATFLLTENGVWVPENSPHPKSPEGLLDKASSYLVDGHYEEAIQLTSELIENTQLSIPMHPRAFLIRGDALFAQNKYYESLYSYETIAKDFCGTVQAYSASEKELEIAILYAHGTKRLDESGTRSIDASKEAEELLIRIQERFPRTPLAEKAAWQLCVFYLNRNNYKLAKTMSQFFIENYPESSYPINDLLERLE